MRNSDFDGQVILFAEEEYLPYGRPPLSKEYLVGKKTLRKFTRTYDDASALNSVLTEGSSLAVVGAGWIGLEVAAGARQCLVRLKIASDTPRLLGFAI